MEGLMGNNKNKNKSQKKARSAKMNALIKRRENVRKNLTARLGRGAMVANAAKLTAMMNKGVPKEEQERFIQEIMGREKGAPRAKKLAAVVEEKGEEAESEAKERSARSLEEMRKRAEEIQEKLEATANQANKKPRKTAKAAKNAAKAVKNAAKQMAKTMKAQTKANAKIAAEVAKKKAQEAVIELQTQAKKNLQEYLKKGPREANVKKLAAIRRRGTNLSVADYVKVRNAAEKMKDKNLASFFAANIGNANVHPVANAKAQERLAQFLSDQEE
jgi:hypothetical protein